MDKKSTTISILEAVQDFKDGDRLLFFKFGFNLSQSFLGGFSLFSSLNIKINKDMHWSEYFLGWFLQISSKIAALEVELDETEARAEESEEWVIGS